MKKYFLLALPVFLILSGFIFGAITKNVSYALKTAKDDESIVLEGQFIAQTDDDKFTFKDDSGEVTVKITKHTDIQPAISSLDKLDGAKVKIRGIVKKEMWEKTKIKVIRLKILEANKDDF